MKMNNNIEDPTSTFELTRFQKVNDELNSESERGAAIFGVALLDELLGEILS